MSEKIKNLEAKLNQNTVSQFKKILNTKIPNADKTKKNLLKSLKSAVQKILINSTGYTKTHLFVKCSGRADIESKLIFMILFELQICFIQKIQLITHNVKVILNILIPLEKIIVLNNRNLGQNLLP